MSKEARTKQYLVFLDQGKAILAEKGGTAINSKFVGSVQLCGLLLVDSCVAMLLQLWHQELVEVIALYFLCNAASLSNRALHNVKVWMSLRRTLSCTLQR